jgi:hypothetical protein
MNANHCFVNHYWYQRQIQCRRNTRSADWQIAILSLPEAVGNHSIEKSNSIDIIAS